MRIKRKILTQVRTQDSFVEIIMELNNQLMSIFCTQIHPVIPGYFHGAEMHPERFPATEHIFYMLFQAKPFNGLGNRRNKGHVFGRKFPIRFILATEGLETFIAELACQNAEPEDVRRLEQRIARMEKAEAQGDSLREEDIAFHRELTAAAHNELAGIVFEAIRPYIDRWVRAREGIVGLRAAASVHRRIVEAVKQGDREAVRSTMAGHFRHVRSLIRAVEKEGREGG